ncbi:Alcohol dehydrogenase [Methanosarcina barkeri str. Wiesmoor]|uniref:Alcohol dehydrogenase n=1 Tax=Methanosarcina barkeri str. Wiesmoor TaxID=1434109 RepID=A0A0E3QKQ3_METBA|nr:iron-containing alcohol dehydrogenase [Methanosarcina barkeri]AKB51483.1 Alcohol dehydrogenase [Methanosarcina barkeri str. Wiesmoor]
MTENRTYTYLNPKVALMGAGCVKEIGKHAKDLGATKALIVSGKSKHGERLALDIYRILEDAGLEGTIFPGADPNPTDTSVMEGADIYRKEDCNIIIAVGGGSPMDCAKAIGIVVYNGGLINDYEGVGKVTKGIPPLITVNTTAGTASEMTSFTIITDTKRHIKMAIVDPRITPDIAVNDPELMVSMPPALTAATGMDALTHAVEAYVSTMATPTTDAAAIKSIELISKYLREAVAHGEDVRTRDMMAHAEYLAGIAFNNASLGYVHSMAHQLGGLYNLPHGVCNAILLPYVEAYNKKVVPERFADIARAMGEKVEGLSHEEAADRAIEAIRKLALDIGIPSGLKELGAKEEDLELLAEHAMQDVCRLTNPRELSKEDIIEIYRKAL